MLDEIVSIDCKTIQSRAIENKKFMGKTFGFLISFSKNIAYFEVFH